MSRFKLFPRRGKDATHPKGRIMSLTLVERHALFSTYRRKDGTFAYLAHSDEFTLFGEPPFTPFKFDFDIHDIRNFWTLFKPTEAPYWMHDQAKRDRLRPHQDRFTQFLEETLEEPYQASDVVWCYHCESVHDSEDGDGSTVSNGQWVCDNCLSQRYTMCYHCEEYEDEVTWIGDLAVCDSCRADLYTRCDHCDVWHRDGDNEDHDHSYEGCCESPAMEFTIRNDGDEPLAQDTRVTVTLPASGDIDDEGLMRIRRLLRDYLSYEVMDLMPTLGAKWQTKEGNYTKRLSRLAYSALKVKIPSDILSEVGNIGGAHTKSAGFTIEVTRNLNLSAYDMGNSSSCWWNGYAESRCALKTNGGFALRTFSNDDDRVTGRSWVMPFKRQPNSYTLSPTFNAMTPDAYVVFNGYGELSGYNAARILAHMAGWTYRKIGFTCDPMYVNAGGYLIAAEELASHYTDGSLRLLVDRHADLYTIEEEESECSYVA